ncbi:MAG TPA: alcohol dehydrogenase catalytic domain-containing protein [Paraburkholderia sp.]|uniref:alcohol dehydrogenase catalytic domain-containing protein n=1 Tax=Paraburkholderia sp. TaxID=1926495 RepID=UPI002B4A34FA|nr:alcohol dehydrogenase catalytic domain-containing protein [Paraburkholderia sp.]HKR42292.1 alcohol dehydrogenase catalytic domain-containing protein [Paraburkholderia sp.]
MTTQVPKKMRAARIYEAGASPIVDEVDVPDIDAEEVLVRVHSCGIVPNLLNVLSLFPKVMPDLPLPPYPAIFGLDPAGEIVQTGSRVKGVKVGDRVYVNPARACNTCRQCMDGRHDACEYFALGGYFGLSPKAKEVYKRYASGGFAEYMRAPSYSVAKIAEGTSFDQAARFGYIGTAFGALRRAGVGPESVVLINGASGTLGLGAVLSALALGARRILGVARNRALLERVKAVAPNRIETWSTEDGPFDRWVLDLTDGEGVDVGLDCLPFGSPPELFLAALNLIRRGGVMVNVGGVVGNVPIPLGMLMTKGVTLLSSNWFTPRHAREMATLAGSGVLDLSVFTQHPHGLGQIQEAVSNFDSRHGGFSNIVIRPQE